MFIFGKSVKANPVQVVCVQVEWAQCISAMAAHGQFYDVATVFGEVAHEWRPCQYVRCIPIAFNLKGSALPICNFKRFSLDCSAAMHDVSDIARIVRQALPAPVPWLETAHWACYMLHAIDAEVPSQEHSFQRG